MKYTDLGVPRQCPMTRAPTAAAITMTTTAVETIVAATIVVVRLLSLPDTDGDVNPPAVDPLMLPAATDDDGPGEGIVHEVAVPPPNRPLGHAIPPQSLEPAGQ